MPTLVKFKSEWGVEFDPEEYRLFFTQSPEEIWKEIDFLIKYGACFGTNECYNEEELWKEDFTITTISEEDAHILTQHLGENFGIGVLSELFDEGTWWREQEEEDDDDEGA